MKRVVFFTEPEWAYGVIHYDLVKWFHREYQLASVMAWNKQYTVQEVQELSQHIDYFISTPSGLLALCIHHYGVAPEQCVVVCHSKEDIYHLLDLGQEFISKLAKIGAVSRWVKEQMIELGITRDINVCTLGIEYAQFKSVPAKELNMVGYAGSYKVAHNDHIKRAHLVDHAVERAGLPLKVAIHYHNSFNTMPGFYPTVGAIVISSTHEGAGLPALEAAAAGRLVISTPVGHWDRVGYKGAVEVPIDEVEFVDRCAEALSFYKNNPKDYEARCYGIREHAKEYDWQYHIESWINLIE